MDTEHGPILIFQGVHGEGKAGRCWLPPWLVQQSPGSQLSQQPLSPREQRPPCRGQRFREDARRGYGVGGRPSPKLSFADDTSIGESSALRVYEEEQRHTRRAPCALGRDAVSLLYIRYQVGNEHDRSFLNQASSGSAAHQLRYTSPDVAQKLSPVCSGGLVNATGLCDEMRTFVFSFCLQPISLSAGN